MKQIIYTFTSKNGLPIRVRYVEPDDAPHLVDVFDHMGADSRYQRFNQTLNNLKGAVVWREAKRIAQVLPQEGLSLMALADLGDGTDTAVAVARYVCMGDGVAEAAISVIDDLQNSGIGTQMMRLLAEEARISGVRKLVATIQNSNTAIWCILQRLPYLIRRKPQGTYSDIEIDLTQPHQPEKRMYDVVSDKRSV